MSEQHSHSHSNGAAAAEKKKKKPTGPKTTMGLDPVTGLATSWTASRAQHMALRAGVFTLSLEAAEYLHEMQLRDIKRILLGAANFRSLGYKTNTLQARHIRAYLRMIGRPILGGPSTKKPGKKVQAYKRIVENGVAYKVTKYFATPDDKKNNLPQFKKTPIMSREQVLAILATKRLETKEQRAADKKRRQDKAAARAAKKQKHADAEASASASAIAVDA